jgi:hypothetical protein
MTSIDGYTSTRGLGLWDTDEHARKISLLKGVDARKAAGAVGVTFNPIASGWTRSAAARGLRPLRRSQSQDADSIHWPPRHEPTLRYCHK